MSVTSTADYFSLLEKSGVLEDSVLEALRERYGELPDAKHLARKLVDRNVLTDWQARFLLSGRHRLKISQYRLLNRFARQRIGDRFLAIHEQLDRKVDVLIFPKDAAHDKKLFQQFLKQASAVAELDHANLLHLYDIDRENGRYFLVFEHDDGDSLRNVPAGSLDAGSIASIARQSLEGIDYAHQRDVIHGRLDESQIRVDSKGRVTIRNMGLAKLLEELQDPNATGGEFDIAPDPADDVVAIGRIGKTLFKQHVGKPVTDSDKALYLLLGKVASVTEVSGGETSQLVGELGAWVERESLENAPKDNIVDLTKSDSQKIATPAKAEAGSQKASQSNNRNTKAGKKVQSQKKAKLMMAAGAVAGVFLLGGGLWFASGMYGGDEADDNKTAESKNASGASLENPTNNAANSPNGNQQEKGYRPESLPKRNTTPNQRAATNNQPEKKKTNALNGGTDTQENNLDAPQWSTVPGANGTTNVEESNPAKDMAEVTTQPNQPQDPRENQQEQTPETVVVVEPPKTIEFAGAEGLPLVAWDQATSHMDKEVVVYGTIKNVSSSNSGKTRYINFGPDDRSKFKIVVRERDIKIEEDVLVEKFLNKHICVRGKVAEFRNNPELVLEFLDQAIVVPALPNAETKLVGKSPSTTSTVATTGAFAGMSGGVQIPELTREAPNFDRVLLGPVKIGEDPMGIFLTVPDEAYKRSIWFGIERDQTGRRWEVSYAPKAKDAESNKQVVAEIHVENDQLFFNWKKTDEINTQLNYLQNCLIEIKTPEESKTVLLRKPIAAPKIVFTEGKPTFKQKFELKYLPIPESIQVEILPLPKAKFETQTNDYGNVLSVDQTETVVFFNENPVHQFFRIWYSVDISTTLRIESALQINTPNKPMAFSKRNLKTIEQNMLAAQSNINRENAAAIEYEPVYGEKTKHKALVKDLAEKLELINGSVAAFQIAKPKISGVFGQELKYRIYYVIGDIQFDLVSPNIKATGDQ